MIPPEESQEESKAETLPITDRLLGEGAGGAVYLARDPCQSDHSPVALKILKDPSPQGLELFEREIRHLSRLKHPGLVEVFGYSRTPTPRFWMEYVPGRNLLQAFQGAGVELKLSWFRECLEALRYLHAQGLLHGDLKPTNILIDGSHHARLLDFGCAGLAGEGVSALEGSFGYMAPELLEGQRYPASDLFALGTVFYEAFAGRIPRNAATSLREFFSGGYRRLKDLETEAPERLARVIDRMIEPDLSLRFKTASDVLKALDGGVLEEAPEAEGIQTYKIFGRDADWQRATALLDQARHEKRRSLVLVHGLSGSGTTRFARELAWHYRLSGRPVVLETAGGLAQNLGRLYRFLRESGDDIWIADFADDGLAPDALAALNEVAAQAHVIDVRLKPLSLSESTEFCKTLLRRELAPELARSFYERTGGNPRFLVELARDVASSGLLGKSHLSPRDLESLSPPASLGELLRRRAAKLDEISKNLLGILLASDAAVTESELTAMAGLSSEKLRETLNGLVSAGLVQATGEGGIQIYRVSHSSPETLLEAVYANEERRAFHERWIAYFEKRVEADRERFYPELARHALRVNHPRAQEWVDAAGDVLSARKEDRKALELYDELLKVTPEKPTLLLRKAINASARLGDYRSMLARIEEFRKISPPDPVGVDEVKYWCFTAVGAKNLGDYAEAARRAGVCLEKGRISEPHHRSWMAKARLILGVVAMADNRLEEAGEHFEKARELAEGGSEALAEILRHEASLHAVKRDAARVREVLQRAEDIYRAMKADRGVFAVLTEAGNASLGLGDLAQTESSYGEALTIAARGENEDLLARAYQNLGVLSCRRGDYARALDELNKARELFLYFGSGYERGLNRLQLALAHAMVGDLPRAEVFLGEARSMSTSPDFLKRLSEVEFQIAMVRAGEAGTETPAPFASLSRLESAEWDLETRWLREILRSPLDPARLRAVLEAIHRQLPDSLKITFEERTDYRRFVAGEGNRKQDKETTAMDILAKLHALTRDLLRSDKMDEILVRVMDAAMTLSKAERGFLLVKTDDPESRLPEIGGYEVKIARNCSKEFLGGEDFRMSLTAVNEAVKSGQPLVTDNALLDKRLQTAESVRVNELKSLVVLPLNAGDEMVGALYLDHPYRTEIFQGADLNILQMFADQAALTLQKARMIEALKKKNNELTERVETQVSEITFLKKTTEEQKLKLNREYAEIVGQSPAMLEVLSLIDRLVDSSIPVWIYGESGTGKEMVARALHFKGPRAKAPFVSENCSSLPETLLESELFGHKKGSFTHADRDKKGLLQHADGGTVFLDEIADMSPAMQSKMLRFLQEGEIRPIGSNQVIKVDVRVISASNKDLNVLIAEGKFREDLFYRLNGVTIPLPPLRERMEDLPLLIKHFLKKTAEKEKKPVLELTGDALKVLMNYNWPGNVRELENSLRTANLFAQKGKIVPQSFEFKKGLFGESSEIPVSAPAPKVPSKAISALKSKPVDAASAEKDLLLKTLHQTAYNKDLTAKTLGISRRYLYTLLERHGVPVQRLTMKAYIEAHLQK